jgi:hypothetical protein
VETGNIEVGVAHLNVADLNIIKEDEIPYRFRKNAGISMISPEGALRFPRD